MPKTKRAAKPAPILEWDAEKNIDEPGGFTNQTRADHAATAIRCYVEAIGDRPLDNHFDTVDAIADLISDLCHMAASIGVDPHELTERALSRFTEER